MSHSVSFQLQPARGISRGLPRVTSVILLAASALTASHSFAATPPAATQIYTTAGSGQATIHGGTATYGASGNIYFATLSVPALGVPSKVIAIDANGVTKWEYPAPAATAAHDMYAIPALNANGTRLYIGSDAGRFYCLDTVTTNSDNRLVWQYPPEASPALPNKIRSGAAIDPMAPLGPTVYFHCNDGKLYALNADTGVQRWSPRNTGNQGGPPTAPDPFAIGGDWNPHPVSSSPVVGYGGVVYVGSADGAVYSFNPSNGQQNWRHPVNPSHVEPIEATLAIGQDGTLYAVTRHHNGYGGTIYAITPGTTSAVTRWSMNREGVAPGFVASPVIDQSGFVYVSLFHSYLEQHDPETGGIPHYWSLPGKLCQTPSINQNGLLIVGVSKMHVENEEFNEIAGIRIDDRSSIAPNAPYWEIRTVAGQELGGSLGSPVIRNNPMGTVFFADHVGKVIKFDSGAMLMAGDWPTFQCGNRRAGKTNTYPMQLLELPLFTQGSATYTPYTGINSMDTFGRVVGQAWGKYGYACGYYVSDFAAAIWQNGSIFTPGFCGSLYLNSGAYATALNGAGDVCGFVGNNAIVWPDGLNSSVAWASLTKTGFNSAVAFDINQAGTIIGYGVNGSTVNGLRWNGSFGTWNTYEVLGAPAGNQAYPFVVTDGERIAGKAKFTANGQFHAFNTLGNPENLSSDARDLGTLGGTASEALDMRDHSGTVGQSQVGNGAWRAFYLPIGGTSLATATQIPPLPGVTGTTWTNVAYGVNDSGKVVGAARNSGGGASAFLYLPGAVNSIDLNTLVLDSGQTPAGIGWSLKKAISINEAGAITGYGTISNRATAFIIYPKSLD